MFKARDREILEVLFNFHWISTIGKHEEIYLAKINFWRDCDLLPQDIKGILKNIRVGEKFSFSFKSGEIFPYEESNIYRVSKKHFEPNRSVLKALEPRFGRFYPLGFFKGIPGVSPQNIRPARVIGIEGSFLLVDTNSPIAHYDLTVEGEVLSVSTKESELGGVCRDWFSLALDSGPGMQVRYKNIPTDFELDNPDSFRREDESDDPLFYRTPRLVGHIDAKAHENLMGLYDTLLPKRGLILDLMSGYQSHIPQGDMSVIGLGLNADELKQNRRLSDFVIKDINKDPILPFEEETFDAVVCDLSIEYVTKPIELIKEVRRVLKRKGVFTVSFSHRYFPPKVIKLWIDLHNFERMGYVLELLLLSEGFVNLRTYSIRGFDRPYDDKYFPYIRQSDPIFVVYAEKK